MQGEAKGGWESHAVDLDVDDGMREGVEDGVEV